jgi:LAGLIDADG endonuclease
VKDPVLGEGVTVVDASSDNASGADNQQERFSIEAVSPDIGHFLAGFALGEGSFMLVCRARPDHRRGWRVSAAFNASQVDVAPLELFRRTLRCGTIRRAGNGGWYYEVNTLRDIQTAVVPFFRRFSLVGQKALDFELFERAVELMSAGLNDETFVEVLRLRERMNRGGKRRHVMEKILRDYTPNSEPPLAQG